MDTTEMTAGKSPRQVLLNFCQQAATVRADISAIAQTPAGHLWIGSDELTTIERLSLTKANEYGNHQQYAVGEYVDLKDTRSEIDIEGMDFSEGYLWVVGSHSTKRKSVKGKDAKQDMQRLLETGTDINRYLLARIPLVDGVPVKHDSQTGRFAARLQQREEQSALTQALKQDDHIGPFLEMGLPSKENGFDIEALAVRGQQLFLGLRGPVLRGMAIILEVEIKETKSGSLKLKKLENNKRYRKHFVDLDGLGVRDLCFQGEDLLILAGPTMQLSSVMQVFRFKNALAHQQDTLWQQAPDALTKLFELPYVPGSDNAEGITLFRTDAQSRDGQEGNPNTAADTECEAALMVAYDSPHPSRLKGDRAIVADVFQL